MRTKTTSKTITAEIRPLFHRLILVLMTCLTQVNSGMIILKIVLERSNVPLIYLLVYTGRKSVQLHLCKLHHLVKNSMPKYIFNIAVILKILSLIIKRRLFMWLLLLWLAVSHTFISFIILNRLHNGTKRNGTWRQ